MASSVEATKRRVRLSDIHDVELGDDLSAIYALWCDGSVDVFNQKVKELEPEFRSDILTHAVAVNNVDLVNHLLDEKDLGVHAECPTSNNHLPLVIAVKTCIPSFPMMEKLDSLEALVRHGADIFRRDPQLKRSAYSVTSAKECRGNAAKQVLMSFQADLEEERGDLMPAYHVSYTPPPEGYRVQEHNYLSRFP